MAAEAQAEVQALLRFLTHDAKVPLAVAMTKYNLLRKHSLSTADAIAKADPNLLSTIFNDDKITKQIRSAANRVSNPRKRAASQQLPLPKQSKQAKVEGDIDIDEADLALPQTHLPVDELRSVEIETNRAPLFLAFALALSAYTLPHQPLSSRLSLAQAVTSAGAQSKAKYIGLTDSTAEDEGWAQGQPSVKLMGRQVAVMRRHVVVNEKVKQEVKHEEEDTKSQATIQADVPVVNHEAFWGIDLEAVKRAKGPLVAGKTAGSGGLPIHKAQAARSYLLKSIDLIGEDTTSIKEEPDTSSTPFKTTKLTAAAKAERRERAVAMLLKTIDHVCDSWSSTVPSDELDRRATAWYAKVRPEVQGGQAGWGQRGKVSLQAIIDLARES